MEKDEFLNKLREMTVHEMRDFIRKKGKGPKKIKPFIILKNNKIETH